MCLYIKVGVLHLSYRNYGEAMIWPKFNGIILFRMLGYFNYYNLFHFHKKAFKSNFHSWFVGASESYFNYFLARIIQIYIIKKEGLH